MKKIVIAGVALFSVIACAERKEAVEILAIPPADAGRGLVRVNKNEFRHYSGNRRDNKYLVTKDAGKTWKSVKTPASYPPNFGGISKESPAIVRNPNTNEFIRVQPIRGYVFISKGGLDGKWGAVTKDGKLDFNWEKSDKSNLVTLGGIMRTPIFVKKNSRILIPTHGGSTSVHISDDGGLTWYKSKNSVKSPAHQPNEIDKGYRWQNGGVEGTIVELKNGKLWIIVRTSQNMHYQSFSDDYGVTWSPATPSRFFGTLTMPTIGRLRDGRLLMLWTNTKALPECYRSNRAWMESKGYKAFGGEDAFTNRDSHHAAISHDDGKTWVGFRELILDEIRNESDYATRNGSEDRGRHQSEFFQFDKHNVIMTAGQHHNHRKILKFDTRFLYEKSRFTNFSNGTEDWTIHSFIPIKAGHCAYNRKPGAFLVNHPRKSSAKVLNIKRVKDSDLINEKYEVNYEQGGAIWNFPNGSASTVNMKFILNKGSQGTQVSLTDRLFNACDPTTKEFAMYTLNLKPGMRLGKTILKPGVSYSLTFKWTNVTEEGKPGCKIYLSGNKGPVKSLPLVNASPNGISYIHLISTAKTADEGLLLESVKANVNGKSVVDKKMQ